MIYMGDLPLRYARGSHYLRLGTSLLKAHAAQATFSSSQSLPPPHAHSLFTMVLPDAACVSPPSPLKFPGLSHQAFW